MRGFLKINFVIWFSVVMVDRTQYLHPTCSVTCVSGGHVLHALGGSCSSLKDLMVNVSARPRQQSPQTGRRSWTGPRWFHGRPCHQAHWWPVGSADMTAHKLLGKIKKENKTFVQDKILLKAHSEQVLLKHPNCLLGNSWSSSESY